MSEQRIPAQSVAFVGFLCHKFQSCLHILEEHLDDNFNEILPHLFFAELGRQVLSDLSSEKWYHLLQDINAALSPTNDDPISNVVALSFLPTFIDVPNAERIFQELKLENLVVNLRVSQR